MNPHLISHDVEAEARLYDRIGDGFAVVAVCMTAWAGWHLGNDSIFASVLLASLMGLVTYGLAQVLKPLFMLWRAKWHKAAVAVAIVASLFFVGEYNGHLMFNSSHRKADIEHAHMQDIRFDDTQSQKAELAEKQKLLKDRLAKLEGAASWVSTKPSAAWKAEIANMEGDKLFARSRQCSSVTRADSRSFCDKLTELRANLAVAEDHDSTVAMLKATETALLNTREKSATMAKGESITADANTLFAQVSTGSLAPAQSALAWTNIGVSGFVSLLSTIGAAFFKWLAAAVRMLAASARSVKEAVIEVLPEANPLQPQIDELKAMLLQMAQYHQPMSNAAVAPVSSPSTHTKELMVVKEDDPRAKQAYDALQQLVEEARQLKAA
jgi:hypothetical protein